MKRPAVATVAVLFTLVSPGSILSVPAAQRDRDELMAVENAWLAGEHDGATLERILADDFVHPVAAGVFLTKAQHIDWAVAHPPGTQVRQSFDQLRIRTYGDVGIVNGIVVATDRAGRQHRTVFTDVFARRNGHWRAVNAQENPVEAVPAR